MNKNKMNKNKITLIAVIAITVILIGVIVTAAVLRGDQGRKPPVVDTTGQTDTTEPTTDESETKKAVEIPPIPDNPETEATASGIDVGEMQRNPEPDVVGGEVQYETKIEPDKQ